MDNRLGFFILTLMLACSATAANEVGQTYTLDGQLFVAGTTTPLSDSAAEVRVQILDPSLSCILYEEIQTVNTVGKSGYFNLQVGSAVGASKRSGTSDPGLTMAQVFQNTVGMTAAHRSGSSCSGLTYTPTANDKRYMRLIVTPTAGVANTLSPDIEIGSAPVALVAQTLQGYSASQFLILGSGDLSQSNLTSVFATGNAAKLTSLLANTPSNYVLRDPTSGLMPLPSGTGTPSGVAAGQIWYDSGSIKYYNGSAVQTLGLNGGGTVTSVSGTSPISVTTGSSTPVISVEAATTTASGVVTLAADSGTTASTVVQATDSRLSDARTPVGTSLSSGQLWIGNGSNVATARTLKISDVASTVSGNWFTATGNCVAGTHLDYTSATDTMSCVSYSLTSSQISTALGYTPADGSGYVAKTGDTMTGTLNLASNGLVVGTNQLVVSSGSVGVGTTSPRATLDVNGTVIGKPGVSNSTSTVDFGTGNSQYTSSSCGSFDLHNLKDGGTYLFAIQGTVSATCVFTAYSDAGVTGLTVHLPTDHGATINSTHTVYNFAVMGSHVYVGWRPGY